jgi:hypothetical protein
VEGAKFFGGSPPPPPPIEIERIYWSLLYVLGNSC